MERHTRAMSAQDPLVDVDRLDDLLALLGDELLPALEESFAHLSKNLDVLEREGASDVELQRAAHAIASSSLQLGMRALGLSARELERAARVGVQRAARVGASRELRAMADRSIVEARAHLARGV
jgi:HPt (histidine-containing phosphotransfer) domain-containing protein